MVICGMRCGAGCLGGRQVSTDGSLCCTISEDKAAKVYDVVNYDMIAMLRLQFAPVAAAWIFRPNDAKARVAIADKDSPAVHIFDARSGNSEPLATVQVSPAMMFLQRCVCSLFSPILGDVLELIRM